MAAKKHKSPKKGFLFLCLLRFFAAIPLTLTLRTVGLQVSQTMLLVKLADKQYAKTLQ